MKPTLGWDCETHLIVPGMLGPRLVVASWAIRRPYGGFGPVFDRGLLLRDEALDVLADALADPEQPIGGHNLLYDFGVACAEDPDRFLRLVFNAYAQGRVKDTMLRQRLLDVAEGHLKNHVEDGEITKSEYALKDLARRHLGREMGGKDGSGWRLRYNELDGVPLEEWPPEAVTYALDDATTPLEILAKQDGAAGGVCSDGQVHIPDEAPTGRAAWALHLMSMWGLRTDGARVVELKKTLQAKRDAAFERLRVCGIVRPNGTKSMSVVKARVEAAYGDATQRTPKGAVVTDRDVLQGSGDPDLVALAEIGSTLKNLSTYVPILEAGARAPICTRYSVPQESGRTSSAAPNLQNPPRAGGVRECFVPRPDFALASADYDTLELRTLAQVCLDILGHSSLAIALSNGEDPHLNVGAELLGISREEAARRYAEGDSLVEEARQRGKPVNFGAPGGLGAETLVAYYAQYGMVITREQAKKILKTWHATWPEMRKYFDYISSLVGPIAAEYIVQPRSGRVRGRVRYCAAANCLDAETEALTRRGWIKGFDLKRDDILLTKNAGTGMLEWQSMTDLKLYPDYEGPLVEFKSKTFSAVSTPNHRWLVFDKKTKKNICKTTETLSQWGDHRIHRGGEYEKTTTEHTDDFVELAGWFLTDGSCRVAQYVNGPGAPLAFLYQSARANPHKVVMIDALLGRLDVLHLRRIRRSQNYVMYTLKKEISKKLHDTFPTRVLTVEFLNSISSEQARLLLKTMLLGDGTSNGKNTIFFTRSKESAQHFQTLCVLAGKSSKMKWRDMSMYAPRISEKMKNSPKSDGIWQVAVYKREHAQVVAHQRREFHSRQPVWCPVVPNTYFVARRAGYTFITGNTFFQGLAADGARDALWRVSVECYLGDVTRSATSGGAVPGDVASRTEEVSPLHGCRPVIFLHDEIVLEVPDDPDVIDGAASRLSAVMVEAMSDWCPDVPIKATPVATRRWFKGAKLARDAQGRIVPVKPVKKDGRTKWVPDDGEAAA